MVIPRNSTLRALLELEQLGLVERTGELRNGQPGNSGQRQDAADP